MVDVPARERPTTPVRLRLARWQTFLFAVVFLLIGSLALALAREAQRCDTTIGRWNASIHSRFFGSCACKLPKLDFRNSCNSQYLPLLMR